MNSLINKQYKFTYMVRCAIANTVEVIKKKKNLLKNISITLGPGAKVKNCLTD